MDKMMMKTVIFLAAALWFFAGEACRALTFEEWIAGYPQVTGADAGQLGDPDKDGIPNLIEYALEGCSPLAFDQPRMPVGVQGVRVLPDLPFANPAAIERRTGAVPAGEWVHFGLRFKPRAGVEDVRFSLCYGDTKGGLHRWMDGDGVGVMTEPDAQGYRILWHLAAWNFDQTKRAAPKSAFYKLKVSKD